jgi:preprotein translocase subunit YajC
MTGAAFAQSATGAAGGSLGNSFGIIVPFALMFVVFYFLLIRPQQKKEKERKSMIESLQKGDRVITSGGMYAVIDSIKDKDVVVLKISGNTKVEFSRNAIQAKVS